MRWQARFPLVLGLAIALLGGCAQVARSPSGNSVAGPSETAMKDYAATDPVPTPVGATHAMRGSCQTSFSADRCQAMAFAAAHQLGVPFDSLTAIDVVPNPSPPQFDFAHQTFLSITLVDGSRQEIVISCPGIAAAFDPPCMNVPTVPVGYPRGKEGGYTDTPGNATPFPSLEPSAVAKARPLTVASLIVPITNTGKRTIVVGTALLPNGYLAEGDFALGDPWPADVLFNGEINLEVRTTADGTPLENLYEHGWHDGVEAVEATITFDVAWFEPGGNLSIVDIVVR